MTPHMMIDLETLGTSSNAVVFSIGAVIFDETQILDTFYARLELDQPGRVIEPDTVVWWVQQSNVAREEFQREKISPLKALENLTRSICNFGVDGVWGNGSDFDNVILASLYKSYSLEPPWKFYKNRCFRTVKKLFPVNYKYIGVRHNALDDALNQAKYLQAIVAEHKFSLN